MSQVLEVMGNAMLGISNRGSVAYKSIFLLEHAVVRLEYIIDGLERFIEMLE